ncbi:hypothetical protein FBU59_001327 [Linderina macrospora]|uniref:Uncharacterized protein n=1 Tax=Linderina macrospora TaxID=4868 RepID=A0ACC1JED1_9FUNG|nr:hypothetical protein FBU59_001327 [Linderina macrospora]
MRLRFGSLRKRATPIFPEMILSAPTVEDTVYSDLVTKGVPERLTVQIDGHKKTVRFYQTAVFDPEIMKLKALKIHVVHSSCRSCMAFGCFMCTRHHTPVSKEVVDDIAAFIRHVPTLEAIESVQALYELLSMYSNGALLCNIQFRANDGE